MPLHETRSYNSANGIAGFQDHTVAASNQIAFVGNVGG